MGAVKEDHTERPGVRISFPPEKNISQELILYDKILNIRVLM